MNDLKKERLLELLADRAIFGLSDEETAELSVLLKEFPDHNLDESFEMTASALNLALLDQIEPMPDNVRQNILLRAKDYFPESSEIKHPLLPTDKPVQLSGDGHMQQTFAVEPKRSPLSWLGWAIAGVACVALAFSLWANRQKPQVIETVREVPPRVLTPSEQLNTLLTSAADVKQASFVDPKNEKEILGDIIWSESQQKGFMKFRNLAVNDKAREAYQLWIVEENQGDKTPIDGGVFDIPSGGEVVIPIDPKLQFKNPKKFAVTVEKPSGAVVSKYERIVAAAKVHI